MAMTTIVWMRTAALILALGAASVDAANIYKCKTKDGGVVVSNTPCARGAEPDAKLSTSAGTGAVAYATPCERVEATGSGLVQIAAKLTPQQKRAVEDEAFGRRNSAGASRLLAEIGRGGVLRVCAFFPGGDSFETVIEPTGLVRRDGVVDADDPVVRSTPPRQAGIDICRAQIDACRSRASAVGTDREECIGRVGRCASGSAEACCPTACFKAYWQPPYDHAAGLAAMQSSKACALAR
jgi:hypothetical protein